MSLHTLYLCYFGLREPLVQTQVLPYLRELTKLDGLKVSLLTFEVDFKHKWTAEQIESEKKKLAGENIEWHCLAYHKSPSAPATAFDVLNGVRFIVNLNRKQKIDVLHARAHIPMTMALMAGKFTKSKMIFDIRGLMAEEYADSGNWREDSKPFRLIKSVERKGIEKASQIVVLTNKFRDYLTKNNLRDGESIEVIPCCVDFSRVEKSVKNTKRERFELVYAGSATGLYLLREMGLFFLELKKHKPEAFFRILTVSSKDFVNEVFGELNISEKDYSITKVAPAEIPDYLKQAHLGISFRKPTFSQIAASPTKIPEYLACGLPVVSNYGIGDTDTLLKSENVGVCLESFEPDEIAKAAENSLELLSENGIGERCAKVAFKYFDLESVGGKNYQKVYRRLANNQI